MDHSQYISKKHISNEYILTSPEKSSLLREKIQSALFRVANPSRYSGYEYNAVRKNHRQIPVKMALAFPDLYEIGMSNLGLKILYEIVNNREDMLAERVFSPAPDMEEIMRREGIPLFSLETFTPLREFDVLGFSLPHELTYTNMLNMLNLAGIPLRSADRDEAWPLLIGGGVCVFNAEPVAPFFDLLVLGDGEEVLIEILEIVKMSIQRNDYAKTAILKELTRLKGVYVPCFYRPQYHQEGWFSGVGRVQSDAPAVVEKRVLADLNKSCHPVRPVVSFREIVHDRAVLEISRGCPRGCRFCQAGVIYRPVRSRSPEKLKKMAVSLIKNTGYAELSLAALSSSDYPQVERLIDCLCTVIPPETNISLPSLRMDSFSVSLAERVQKEHKTSITFAPEAATARLRKVIRKDISEDEIDKALLAVFRAGWHSVKLYLMIGLPTETDEDIMGIAAIARRAVELFRQSGRRERLKVVVSTSVFIPKAQTSFQWEPMLARSEISRRQSMLAKALRPLKQVDFRWNDPQMSLLEGAFSRGDRRLADVLEEAWKHGCRFDNWSEHFNFTKWLNAFKAAGQSMEDYACRRYGLGDPLPWGHLLPPVKQNYLADEYLKSQMEAEG